MPKPRKSLISLEATPYYHCVARCVRRAFLCDRDQQTAIDYEHRRGWIKKRILELSQTFALDVCAYAVMSNHYHIVLHINAEEPGRLDEVIDRWHTLFKGTVLTHKYQANTLQTEAELEVVKDLVAKWKLMSISWFMGFNLNAVIVLKGTDLFFIPSHPKLQRHPCTVVNLVEGRATNYRMIIDRYKGHFR